MEACSIGQRMEHTGPSSSEDSSFGIDLVQRAMKSDKEMLFPVDAIARTKDAGAITYKYSILGSTNIFTVG
jgi:hypothetical protein